LRQQLLLAIAILRRPAATEYLIELVATAEEETTAGEALAALQIYKEDPRLRERVSEAVREKGNARLQAAFDREFR
jgi:hypothetical protein